jgi:hypothetical protein
MAVLTISKFNTRFNKFKKQEKDVTEHCDFIYWFVDVLGNPDTVQAILRKEDRNSTVSYVKRKSGLKKLSESNTKRGVVFVGNESSGGHFHAIRGNIIQDSYTLGYQIPGTNSFCQLFSIMIYFSIIKPDKYHFDFKSRNYAHNIQVAMKFLKSFLQKKENKAIRDKILSDIRTFESRDHPDDASWMFLVEEPRKLRDITLAQFYEFIDNVSAFSRYFTNCT